MKSRKKNSTSSADLFASWKGLVNWKKRVKAVCKPCWELKYCPYGPLVEEFPLKMENDSQSCRIFGHDCPVFHVAEPFTETKELRNLSREIPRPVQFRVFKRENQICSVCTCNVRDQDAHFDHIIPYSKGGSSDESNIRLLCSVCNLRRGNKFEDEYLVANAFEHMQKPLDIGFLHTLLDVFAFAQEFTRKQNRFPGPNEIAAHFSPGKVSAFEERLAETLLDFQEVFSGKRPTELTKNQFEALNVRWGFSDGEVYRLASIADEFGESTEHLVLMEKTLLSRAGWYFDEKKSLLKKWEKS